MDTIWVNDNDYDFYNPPMDSILIVRCGTCQSLVPRNRTREHAEWHEKVENHE